ncbi:MAG: hypothetical protein HZT40_08165 [Candidatus Thiothrix singaporensis]|uniref:Uncharacterized protein n=1 Tax=Candidatus Thiothrix singaporensis TaxID=2799669 RepID=A0A7L6ARG9_9GAMM|nr:MAG: hypothetical protein HZT40_08165 [Candidatus Thiothrix singaporensis]
MTTPVSTEQTPAGASGHGMLNIARHVLKIDSILFVGIMCLAVLGWAPPTLMVPASAYWSYMLVLMALGTTLWGEWRSRRLGAAEGGKLLYRQLVLWGAALAAMGLVYLLLGSGRLNYEVTGLLVLLVLAFATFVDGMLVSWKLHVVGALLFFIVLMLTFVERFLWEIILVAGVLVALVLGGVIWKLHRYTHDPQQGQG